MMTMTINSLNHVRENCPNDPQMERALHSSSVHWGAADRSLRPKKKKKKKKKLQKNMEKFPHEKTGKNEKGHDFSAANRDY